MDTSTTSTSTASTDAAERHQLLFALHYGRRYGVRAARLYGRIASLLRFSELVLGSAAAAAFFAKAPEVSAWCGIGMASISAINIAFDPGAKAKDASVAAEKFGQALVNAPEMPLDQLRIVVRTLQSIPLNEIESLREPVWNDVVKQLGLTQTSNRLGLTEWLISAAA